MSRQQISPHFHRLLRLWPTDPLRPSQRHFQRLLQTHIQKTADASSESTQQQRQEANTAYLLLDNTFAKQFPLSSRMMKPASDPEHYERLAREFEEAPGRTWWRNLVKRVGGMVRFS